MMKTKLYWHVYGGITPEDHEFGGGHYCAMIGEESTISNPPVSPENFPWISLLKTFDYEPSEKEIDDLKPIEFRDSEDEIEVEL